MSTKYGPLWQIEQAVESKKSCLKAFVEDRRRIDTKIEETLIELKEYEEALDILNRGKVTA